MKVALVAPAISIHTARWARALAERGLEVHLVSSQTAHASLAGSAVSYHRLPWGGRLGYFLNVASLRRLLARLQADLVHAHYASGYGTLARLTGWRPWALSIWGDDVYDFPVHSAWRRRLICRNLTAADWLFSTSHAMAGKALELAPAVSRLSVVPFGIDVTRFAPRTSRAVGGPITIGTVKTLENRYGVDILIEAFDHCRQRLAAEGQADAARRLRLAVTGSGCEASKLKALTAQRGLAAVTAFKPRVPHDQVPRCLHELDIYVAASRRESFGVAVLEASSCGLPVVVSRVGGLPEVVVDGQTGIVVPPDDPRTLAAALVQLVLDRHMRHALGEAGRLHVLQHYRWEDNVEGLLAIYDELRALGVRSASRAA